MKKDLSEGLRSPCFLLVATRGRISRKDLDRARSEKLNKAAILCSDADCAYNCVCKRQDTMHKISLPLNDRESL